ncbi:ADP-ribosylglycohydrolase family protein [Streptomyces europaeiscabiei]|uniref:ADP-ribosylglycohydrolase family protein n=3 Tax=Streptomyces TaxID=1883 RepID=UPI0029A303E5|nr:ADP-ribosylglycohydrolase family protein [Streptomyces europaeiscabiei]MDX3581520.1 ADP-ribosylglycohydrolase family protein [Streptomyces europaeiscabiei]MDX3633010.1 ADP-ribosylglycohydrolase family protein [Streptomyces europaeiscabiei]MDX3650481.1 ADP-ribosylglycohydrolase family protein [Streptomyces europaeiscabiei]
MTPLRLTWVQPEDLLGHELHQAVQDGREPSAIAARWRGAGGPPAPPRAGASPHRTSRYLRQLAEDLLDELADLPSSLAEHEPTELSRIKALCPDWPMRPAEPTGPAGPPRPGHSTHPAQPAGSRAAGAARVGAGGTLQAQARDTLPTPATYTRRLEAAWLGRAVGCLLGKPVEKLPLPAIRQLARATGNWPLTTWFTARGVPPELLAAHPWNRRSAPTSLAENIDGMPEDDDLNYPLLNLLLLARHGRDFTTTDVARLWLDELPAGRTFTAERIAYRNLLTGIDPPHTARHRNPFREWIGALIRADVHGWTNPGDPATAAEQAHRDAALTHTANGVYAAMFVAATIADAATGTHDVHHCLRTGLKVVPPDSRLAKAIDHALRLATGERDFDTVVDELHSTYADHHWVHALPNTALLTAALTHADGDFTASVCRAVSGGWDTDSNGATAGSIAGLLTGSPDALPDRWTAPLKNRLATSVADFNGVGFDTLAHLTLRETPHP